MREHFILFMDVHCALPVEIVFFSFLLLSFHSFFIEKSLSLQLLALFPCVFLSYDYPCPSLDSHSSTFKLIHRHRLAHFLIGTGPTSIFLYEKFHRHSPIVLWLSIHLPLGLELIKSDTSAHELINVLGFGHLKGFRLFKLV